jgi:hypothetical protein
MSIRSVDHSFNVEGSSEKLSIEPITPNPGPTLLIQAMDAEKLVNRS